MAELLRTTRPTDLTQIRKTHGGQFPFWRVYRVIDGREDVRGHGMRDMPIWGQRYFSGFAFPPTPGGGTHRTAEHGERTLSLPASAEDKPWAYP